MQTKAKCELLFTNALDTEWKSSLYIEFQVKNEQQQQRLRSSLALGIETVIMEMVS
ncbi:hypothetical protein, partial, partial [Absidia glauca]